MENRFVALLIVVIIIIILWFFIKDRRQHLDGLYVGTPEFLEEADLGEFYLFVGDPSYLIIANKDGDIIENTPLDLKPFICLKEFIKGKIKFNVTLKNQDVIPEKLKLSLNSKTGSLIVEDDKKIYAVLVKDNIKTRELFS